MWPRAPGRGAMRESMPPGTLIITVALHVACLALLAYWGAGLARLIRTSRTVPTARDGLELAQQRAPTESVCVVVPAHNEERVIGRLVRSLRAQDHPRTSFVLCLDRCTDATLRLAREAMDSDRRFEIVEISECPEGWAGKVHAAWCGVTQSSAARIADVLLFADADTDFDPGCVRATLALMEDRNLDLLSLLSTLTVERWYERLVQPAAGLELVTQYPLIRAARAEGRRAFANGQFMMFRRSAYEVVGGHEAVREELLEDLALARLFADRRLPAGVFVAEGMLRCTMYQTWEAFRRGWKRIFIESAKRKPGRLVRWAWRVRLFGAVLPALAAVDLGWSLGLAARDWGPMGVVGVGVAGAALAAWLLVPALALRLGGTSMLLTPGYGLGAWIVGGLLLEAARDLARGAPVEWGGRRYVRPAR